MADAADAQSLTGEQVLSGFYKSLNDLETLHYTISSIDTFISGHAWKQSGEAMLMGNHSNQKFPFKLYGRDVKNNELIFDGKKALSVSHSEKEFSLKSISDYREIIGVPGGQLILAEFVFPETAFNAETALGYNKLEVEELPDQYILTLHYPQNIMFGIRDRIKRLTIDKKTWMPVAYFHKINGFEGEKQVNIRTLENIHINGPKTVFPAINPHMLTGYREIISKQVKPTYEELLHTPFIDMELKDIHGSMARLSDKKDKVILLDFWEIWCGPCIESIPKIKQLVSKYSREDFEVWSIASDTATFSKVGSTVKRLGITYPVYYGNEQTKKDYRVTGVPEYVIIDRSGKIAFIHAGFTEDIEKTLDALLK